MTNNLKHSLHGSPLLADRKRAEAAREISTKRQVEDELDIRVFYIFGEEHGPVRDELRVGTGKWGMGGEAFKKLHQTHSTHRARKVIVHVEHCVVGEGAVKRLNAAVLSRFSDHAKKISDLFWKIEPEAARAIVAEVVGREGIAVLSVSEAEALQSEKIRRLMDRQL